MRKGKQATTSRPPTRHLVKKVREAGSGHIILRCFCALLGWERIMHPAQGALDNSKAVLAGTMTTHRIGHGTVDQVDPLSIGK